MKIIYSDRQQLHCVPFEVLGGEPTPNFEQPQRALQVLDALSVRTSGPVLPPSAHGLAPLKRVHSPDYVDFLADAWNQWQATFPGKAVALPFLFPNRGLRQRLPRHIEGRLGYYAFDLSVGLTATSWSAIQDSADCALTAADLLLAGECSAFALCRPPGHHAGRDLMGGYCYLNNAAIAAQYLLDQGQQRIAILDLDYHHGNGTQSIFYERSDVLFASIHGDPDDEYPHYLGFADETGAGEGVGFNLNLPLPLGETDWSRYRQALDSAIERIQAFAPDTLVISLGLDTFCEDPLGEFSIKSLDYLEMGRILGGMGLPTLFVFEGGYAVDALGNNTANVVEGFEQKG
ncbi:histone deacetylase family protein [Aestuariirhabdus litorea]|uniref:Histone deacetylase family protein n=1 Tax=Aestuariirhabdus litorea TaxID=2528527 RepID=A0A3P3VKX4_9GAMM|nr:histone deacetylase family protein [Aestuariirhabdus litorea]RRJ83330.1 histone deacetylase family protein [Aestuariirhabdus litorea]RWW93490.1 histone deacetylase family protein [Endozoicomonadaceae bacterium GTF-13]